jgi:hypothetical protein
MFETRLVEKVLVEMTPKALMRIVKEPTLKELKLFKEKKIALGT